MDLVKIKSKNKISSDIIGFITKCFKTSVESGEQESNKNVFFSPDISDYILEVKGKGEIVHTPFNDSANLECIVYKAKDMIKLAVIRIPRLSFMRD